MGKPGKPYNIGGEEEISIWDLSKKVATIINSGVDVVRSKANDVNYLIDNPQRRCPDISRARDELNYLAKVKIDCGLRRSIKWYQDSYPHLRS